MFAHCVPDSLIMPPTCRTLLGGGGRSFLVGFGSSTWFQVERFRFSFVEFFVPVVEKVSSNTLSAMRASWACAMVVVSSANRCLICECIGIVV